jgi:hypothetical protein
MASVSSPELIAMRLLVDNMVASSVRLGDGFGHRDQRHEQIQDQFVRPVQGPRATRP